MNDLLAAAASNKTFEDIVYTIAKLINGVIPLSVAVCLFVFFWGVADVIVLSRENAEKLKEGRARMFWSLLALFVVVSLSGILNILEHTLKGQ